MPFYEATLSRWCVFLLAHEEAKAPRLAVGAAVDSALKNRSKRTVRPWVVRVNGIAGLQRAAFAQA